MKVTAVVTEVNDKYSIVESERLAACDACHKHADGCSVCSLMGSNKTIRSRAENKIDARVGDVVEIETETKKVLAYAALVFIFPILTMLVFYFVASLFSEISGIRYASAALGFVISFVIVWLYSRLVSSKKYDVVIAKIIKRKE